MAPKKALAIAAEGRSKSIAPTCRLIDKDNVDPTYVPPTGRTSPTAPRTTQNQHKKVVPDVVTASQSDEEDTLIGSPAWFASGYESHSTSGTASSSATGSSSHVRAASTDEATSSREVQCHQTPTLLRLLRSLTDGVLQTKLDSLRADLDAILSPHEDEPEYAHTALADDTVLEALYSAEGLKKLKVLNISQCKITEYLPPLAPMKILTELDESICKKASWLDKFLTCMSDSCITCQHTRNDEGFIRWYKYADL
uniref:Integrase core domain containing protein n=1 Tax=Solanum tuberosum TaxID=4113 RepID=M1CYR5_SOLTU